MCVFLHCILFHCCNFDMKYNLSHRPAAATATTKNERELMHCHIRVCVIFLVDFSIGFVWLIEYFNGESSCSLEFMCALVLIDFWRDQLIQPRIHISSDSWSFSISIFILAALRLNESPHLSNSTRFCDKKLFCISHYGMFYSSKYK